MMTKRNIVIVAAIGGTAAAVLAVSAAMPWYRLRSVQAKLEAAITRGNLKHRKNVSAVKVGMNRGTVLKLLGPPMLCGTGEDQELGGSNVLTDLYTFIDHIEWGDTFYNLHGTSVSVDYAADNETVAKVEVQESGCIHADMFEQITVEMLEDSLRSMEKSGHNPGVERASDD